MDSSDTSDFSIPVSSTSDESSFEQAESADPIDTSDESSMEQAESADPNDTSDESFFEQAESADPIDTSNETAPPSIFGKAKLVLIIIGVIVIFVVALCVCAGVVVGIIFFVGGKEKDLTYEEDFNQKVSVPDGWKLWIHNHFIFSPNTRNVIRGESSLLMLPEIIKKSSYEIVDVTDEIYYLSEDKVKLECEITCVCYSGEFRRQMPLPTVLKLGVIVVGLFVFNYYLDDFNTACRTECDSTVTFNRRNTTRDAQMESGYADEVECVPEDLPEDPVSQ